MLNVALSIQDSAVQPPLAKVVEIVLRHLLPREVREAEEFLRGLHVSEMQRRVQRHDVVIVAAIRTAAAAADAADAADAFSAFAMVDKGIRVYFETIFDAFLATITETIIETIIETAAIFETANLHQDFPRKVVREHQDFCSGARTRGGVHPQPVLVSFERFLVFVKLFRRFQVYRDVDVEVVR